MTFPKVREAPERIYLNVGDLPYDVDFDELSDVTWCEDKQDDSDLEYRLVKRRSGRKLQKRGSTVEPLTEDKS